MDATCFTQKSQNLLEAVIFTLNSQNTQNLPDSNMGSLCASYNLADSTCQKKRLFQRFQETLAFPFKIRVR